MMTGLATTLAQIAAGAAANQLETGTLEFKEDRGQDVGKDVADAALCFANSQGGLVVVGVSDKKRGRAAILGTQVVIDELRRRVYELSVPHVTVEASEHFHDGVRLVVVRVPAGMEVHADTQGRAKWRVGRDCIPMTPSEVARLRDERGGFDWSAESTELGTSELLPEPVEIARKRLARAIAPEQRRLAKLPLRDLMSALGVVDQRGRLRRAGELLFVNRERRPLITYQYRRTPGGESRQVVRRDDAALLAFEAVLRAVDDRRESVPVTLRNGQQLTLEDYPVLAVREVVANALMHRDYRLQGAVEIEHSPQQLVVVSPGPLVHGVTPGNILTTPSKPRNKCLAGAFRLLGIAEETGRGVDRIYRELIRAGKDVPTIEDTGTSVRVLLMGGPPKANIARVVAQLPEEEREDTDALLALFALCAARTIAAPTFHRVVQRSVDETERSLRRLAAAPVELIEPTRESARRSHPSYRLRSNVLKELGSAVPYQRRSVDNIDQRVINHLVEYQTITNRAVQNLFEVSLIRARNILSDLVRRRLLEKVSDHERGPGVEYGPGAIFPKAAKRRRSKKR